jgi:hypothetical protein
MTKLLGFCALAAMTLTFTHSAALADDGMPIEGPLGVSFTASPTSPGIFDFSANGMGNLSNVGYVSFQLQKTIDFTGKIPTMVGTYTITAENGDTLTGTLAGTIGVPGSTGYNTFSGQITVTAGTGRFQSASGIVSFSGFSKNNSGTGQAVYSFKGVLHM